MNLDKANQLLIEIEKKKHPGGRPSEYDSKLPGKLIAFFDRPAYVMVKVADITGKNDFHKEEFKPMPNQRPTIERFCWENDIHKSTLHFWLDAKEGDGKTPRYPELIDAYARAKSLYEEFLTHNGLSGVYPPAAFVFVAKNTTGMKDKVETQLSGEVGVRKIKIITKETPDET